MSLVCQAEASGRGHEDSRIRGNVIRECYKSGSQVRYGDIGLYESIGVVQCGTLSKTAIQTLDIVSILIRYSRFHVLYVKCLPRRAENRILRPFMWRYRNLGMIVMVL